MAADEAPHVNLLLTDIDCIDDDSGYARLMCKVDVRHLKQLIAGAELTEQWLATLLVRVVPIDQP